MQGLIRIYGRMGEWTDSEGEPSPHSHLARRAGALEPEQLCFENAGRVPADGFSMDGYLLDFHPDFDIQIKFFFIKIKSEVEF